MYMGVIDLRFVAASLSCEVKSDMPNGVYTLDVENHQLCGDRGFTIALRWESGHGKDREKDGQDRLGIHGAT